MVTLAIPYADIGLYLDFADTRLALPVPDVVTGSTTQDRTFVLFDGDTRPTGWRGTSGGDQWQVSVEYGPSEQSDAVALIELFAAAYEADDGRLQLRTTGASVAGLDVLAVVEVPGWTPTRTAGGGVEVAFTATAVQYDVAE